MTKEEIERASFETFLQVGGKVFDRFESAQPPEPDIVAYSGDHIIGVEITAFCRKEEKQRESEEDKLIARSQRLYEALGLPCLGVSFHWAPQGGFGRKSRECPAEKIVELVVQHAPKFGEWVEIDWQSFDPELQTLLSMVVIERLCEHERNHWRAPRAGFLGQWTPDLLQQEISRKSSKPRDYCGRYAEIWLLLVSPDDAPSGWNEMNEATRNGIYVTPYNRVYLLSSIPFQVYELKVNGLDQTESPQTG